MPPAQSSAFHTDTTGELVHTGVQVSRAPGARRASSMATARPRAVQAGALLVAGVMEGSAAERAGVAVGDEVLAINGSEAASLPEECVPMAFELKVCRHEEAPKVAAEVCQWHAGNGLTVLRASCAGRLRRCCSTTLSWCCCARA